MIKSWFFNESQKVWVWSKSHNMLFLDSFCEKTIRHEKKSKVSNLVLTAFGNIRLWLRRGKKTHKKYALVGVWTNPFEKYRSKSEIFPDFRGENEKKIETTTQKMHLPQTMCQLVAPQRDFSAVKGRKWPLDPQSLQQILPCQWWPGPQTAGSFGRHCWQQVAWRYGSWTSW